MKIILLLFCCLMFFLVVGMVMPELVRAETRILFLGDSLTAGFGVKPEEAFPSVLKSMLHEKGYKNLIFINAGISGSTTASALSRLRWHKRVKPDILFLAMGANDGLRGLSLEAMEKNLNNTIETALAAGMKITLSGMEIPPNYGLEYTSGFREVFLSLAKKHNIPLMPFLLKDVAGLTRYNQGDGIHPNAEGYKIIAANALPYIIDMLNKK